MEESLPPVTMPKLSQSHYVNGSLSHRYSSTLSWGSRRASTTTTAISEQPCGQYDSLYDRHVLQFYEKHTYAREHLIRQGFINEHNVILLSEQDLRRQGKAMKEYEDRLQFARQLEERNQKRLQRIKTTASLSDSLGSRLPSIRTRRSLPAISTDRCTPLVDTSIPPSVCEEYSIKRRISELTANEPRRSLPKSSVRTVMPHLPRQGSTQNMSSLPAMPTFTLYSQNEQRQTVNKIDDHNYDKKPSSSNIHLPSTNQPKTYTKARQTNKISNLEGSMRKHSHEQRVVETGISPKSKAMLTTKQKPTQHSSRTPQFQPHKEQTSAVHAKKDHEFADNVVPHQLLQSVDVDNRQAVSSISAEKASTDTGIIQDNAFQCGISTVQASCAQPSFYSSNGISLHQAIPGIEYHEPNVSDIVATENQTKTKSPSLKLIPIDYLETKNYDKFEDTSTACALTAATSLPNDLDENAANINDFNGVVNSVTQHDDCKYGTNTLISRTNLASSCNTKDDDDRQEVAHNSTDTYFSQDDHTKAPPYSNIDIDTAFSMATQAVIANQNAIDDVNSNFFTPLASDYAACKDNGPPLIDPLVDNNELNLEQGQTTRVHHADNCMVKIVGSGDHCSADVMTATIESNKGSSMNSPVTVTQETEYLSVTAAPNSFGKDANDFIDISKAACDDNANNPSNNMYISSEGIGSAGDGNEFQFTPSSFENYDLYDSAAIPHDSINNLPTNSLNEEGTTGTARVSDEIDSDTGNDRMETNSQQLFDCSQTANESDREEAKPNGNQTSRYSSFEIGENSSLNFDNKVHGLPLPQSMSLQVGEDNLLLTDTDNVHSHKETIQFALDIDFSGNNIHEWERETAAIIAAQLREQNIVVDSAQVHISHDDNTGGHIKMPSTRHDMRTTFSAEKQTCGKRYIKKSNAEKQKHDYMAEHKIVNAVGSDTPYSTITFSFDLDFQQISSPSQQTVFIDEVLSALQNEGINKDWFELGNIHLQPGSIIVTIVGLSPEQQHTILNSLPNIIVRGARVTAVTTSSSDTDENTTLDNEQMKENSKYEASSSCEYPGTKKNADIQHHRTLGSLRRRNAVIKRKPSNSPQFANQPHDSQIKQDGGLGNWPEQELTIQERKRYCDSIIMHQSSRPTGCNVFDVNDLVGNQPEVINGAKFANQVNKDNKDPDVNLLSYLDNFSSGLASEAVNLEDSNTADEIRHSDVDMGNKAKVIDWNGATVVDKPQTAENPEKVNRDTIAVYKHKRNDTGIVDKPEEAGHGHLKTTNKTDHIDTGTMATTRTAIDHDINATGKTDESDHGKIYTETRPCISSQFGSSIRDETEVVHLGGFTATKIIQATFNSDTEAGKKPVTSGDSDTEAEKKPVTSGDSDTKAGKKPVTSGDSDTDAEKKPVTSGDSDTEAEKKPVTSCDSDTEAGKKPVTSGDSDTDAEKKPVTSGDSDAEAEK
eukprot:gene5947-9101_t